MLGILRMSLSAQDMEKVWVIPFRSRLSSRLLERARRRYSSFIITARQVTVASGAIHHLGFLFQSVQISPLFYSSQYLIIEVRLKICEYQQ